MTALNRNRTLFLICLVFFIFGLLLVPGLSSAAEPIDIVSVSPDKVSNSGGETITIRGNNFVPAMKVFFNNTEVDSRQVDIDLNASGYDTVQVICPEGPTGYVNVRLEDSADSSNSDMLLQAFWYRSTPEITGVTPNQGTTLGGTTVNITGNELGEAGSMGSGIEVYIGTTRVEDVSRSSSTAVSITAPPGTLGAKSITITNADGGTCTVPSSSALAFTYILSEPKITKVSPDFGSILGGTEITIEGSDFSPDSKVKVGDHWAQEVTHISSTRLTAVTPKSEATGSVNVTVINPDGATAPASAFNYINTPTITNITPNYGVPGADCSANPVVIYGTNFASDVQVFFGGVIAENIEKVSDSQINVLTLPNVSPGTVHVKVVNQKDARQEFTLPNGFTFKSAQSSPEITALTPNSGSTETATKVTIQGQQLLTEARLFIGNKEISLENAVFEGTGRVVVVVPPSGTAGKQAVKWVNSDGGEFVFGDDASEAGFTYVRPADMVKITSITPTKGPEDRRTPITISGINFVNPGIAGNSLAISIGDVAIRQEDIKWIDSRTIYATTPLGYVKEGETQTSWDVTVVQSFKDSDGNSITQSYTLTGGFTYVLPGSSPFISEIYDLEIFRKDKTAINSGPLAGGNKVVIVGTDFRTHGETMPAVEFGTNFAWQAAQVVDVVSISPGQTAPDYVSGLPAYQAGTAEMAVIAIVPAGTATGSVDVRITNPDLGTAVLSNGWIYKTCNLMITAVTPDSGPVTGGVKVVISGANFDEDSTVSVEFVHKNEDGSTETTVVEKIYSVTANQIQFDLPPSIAGKKDVIVRNRFGKRTLENGFTYLGLTSGPIIEGVAPSQGTAAGGDQITITGQDFRSDSTVTIGGASAKVVSVTWDTIVAVTPPGTPGPRDVVVTNPDGSKAAARGGFVYISYPVVKSVTPSVVNTAGGTVVIVKGDQFYPGAKVFFKKAGTEAPSPETQSPEVQVIDIHTIYARVPKVYSGTGAYDVIVRNPDYDAGTGLGEGVLEKGILFEDPPAVSPSVISIYPNRGPTTGGTEAVVFCDEKAAPDARIFIGLKEAQVQEYLGAGRFRVIIPPNEEGDYYVTVTNPDGGTGVSAQPIFQYRLPSTEMKITSIAPNIGSIEGGTFVTIRGTDFRSGAEVFFGSKQANPNSVTVTLEDPVSKSYKITCYTPPGSIGFVDVAVINPDNSFGVALVKNGFEYRNPDSRPKITSVMPVSGPTTGGTAITVKGSDFRTGIKLYLDGLSASEVVLVDSETITAVTPAHSPGKTFVTVVNYDGGSFTYGDDEGESGFTYALPGSSPRIDSVDPEFGPAGRTTWTTITGLDFRTNAKVYFGAVESPKVEYIDYQTLRALAPAQEAGKVNVTVVNEDFGTGVLKGGFTYRSSVPQILSVSPNMGSRTGGDIVTISGREFMVEYAEGTLSTAPSVYFEQGQLSAQAEVLEGSTAEALIIRTPAAPNGVIGFYDVRVVNFDGAQDVLAKGFKYSAPDSQPVITSIDPSSGTVLGGTPVKIYGTDFRDDAWVFIGGKEAANVEVVDGTTIKAVTPAHSPGAKDVTVVNYDGGSFTLEDGFTYSTPLSEPMVISVSPNKGPHIGGTCITITGRDFRAGAKVYIGGEQCRDIVVVDYKTITAVTPAGEPGPVDVTVVNADMGSATLKKGFSFIYVQLPVIADVTPNQGPAEGGTEITVNGSNFAKGLTLAIGGEDAEIVKVSTGEIQAVTPPGKIGLQDVVVINPDGGQAVLEEGFEYKRSRTVPDTPGALEATAVDKFTVKLEWETSEFANYFEIFVRERGEDNYRFVDQTKSNVNVYYVTGLEPGTTYYFQVRAVNEKGLSGFTATDSARTKSGSSTTWADEEREEIEENVQVILGQGSVTLAASSRAALKDCGYTFDFTDAASVKTPVKIVQLNADAAQDIQQEVRVNLPGCQITVPAALWNLPGINSLSNSEKRESLVRIIITDAGQREAESALVYLPSGAKVISKVYSLRLEVVSRGRSEAVDLFSSPISIAFEVPASGSRLRNVGVYSRNLSGTWTKASGSSVSYSTARAYTYCSTVFLLAGF